MQIFELMDACFVLLIQDAIMLAPCLGFILYSSFLTFVADHLLTLDQDLLVLLYEFQLFALWLLPQHCQFIVVQGKEFVLQDGEIHLFPELQFTTVSILLEVDVGHEVVEEPKIAVVERIRQWDQ